MPITTDQITVDPQGVSMVIDIKDHFGTSVTCYTASGGSSAFTLPVTISTATDFFLTEGGYYTVSAKLGGTEIAGSAGQPALVQAAQGVPVRVVPVLDQVEQLEGAGSGGSSAVSFARYTASATVTDIQNGPNATLTEATADASGNITLNGTNDGLILAAAGAYLVCAHIVSGYDNDKSVGAQITTDGTASASNMNLVVAAYDAGLSAVEDSRSVVVSYTAANKPLAVDWYVPDVAPTTGTLTLDMTVTYLGPVAT